jgi:uroporphyrinogen-III synthase
VLQLRGNVPTRIKKVVTGEFDAVVLAKAGVKRLGLLNSMSQLGLVAIDLPFVAAPCQGIIGLQHLKAAQEAAATIENKQLTAIAKAEKLILAFLGGGCQLPLGAQISTRENQFSLKVFFEENGKIFEGEFTSATIDQTLRSFFDSYLCVKPSPRVWLSQPLQHALKPARLLVAKGRAPVIWPLLEVSPCWNPKDIQNVDENKNTFGAVSFSSQFAVQLFMSEVGAVFDVVPWLKQRAVFGVGAATVAKLSSYGVTPVMSGAKAHGKALADRIQSTKIKGKLLIPGQKTSTLTKHLRDISGQVYPLPLYKVRPGQSVLTMSPPEVRAGDQIVITSPSAAREFVIWCRKRTTLKDLKVWAFGPSTSKELTFFGIHHKTTPESGSWEALIAAL